MRHVCCEVVIFVILCLNFACLLGDPLSIAAMTSEAY